MGNTCCPNKNPEEEVGRKPKKGNPTFNGSQPASNYSFEGSLSGITVVIRTGNISNEGADAIVIATVDAEKLNQEVSAKRGSNDEPLQNGEVIVTGPATLKNVEYVIHISIPVWRGGNHQEITILERGFQNALKEATANNMKTIIFTDPASTLFGIPKQHTAKALINAIRVYGESCQSLNKVETIKFIHREQETVLIFEDSLRLEMGMKSDRAQSAYSDHLQGSNIADLDLNVQKQQLENQRNIDQKILQDEVSTQQE